MSTLSRKLLGLDPPPPFREGRAFLVTDEAVALAREVEALEALIHEKSGLDDHHPHYSPEWALTEMADSWASESAALEAAESKLERVRAVAWYWTGDAEDALAEIRAILGDKGEQ